MPRALALLENDAAQSLRRAPSLRETARVTMTRAAITPVLAYRFRYRGTVNLGLLARYGSCGVEFLNSDTESSRHFLARKPAMTSHLKRPQNLLIFNVFAISLDSRGKHQQHQRKQPFLTKPVRTVTNAVHSAPYRLIQANSRLVDYQHDCRDSTKAIAGK